MTTMIIIKLVSTLIISNIIYIHQDIAFPFTTVAAGNTILRLLN